MKYSCNSKIDRSRCCYKCGSDKHRAQACTTATPKCVICEEKGLNASHRMGSAICSLDRNANKNRPLPRIRREELEARNARKIVTTDSRTETGEIKEDPARRATEIDMEIDNAVPS